MPELTVHSTPTAQPLPLPFAIARGGDTSGTATLPIIDPADWEDFPVFRETFLMYVTDPAYNTALRIFGRLLHELVLEYYRHWPNWQEGVTATELRAAVADLRHLEGHLGAVGREHAHSAEGDHLFR